MCGDSFLPIDCGAHAPVLCLCRNVGFQLRAGWGLPFPLNLLFLPLRLWEGFLAYYVAK